MAGMAIYSVSERGLEPPRGANPTRSLAWRVFQFRHSDRCGSAGDCTADLAQGEGQSEGADPEQDPDDDREPIEIAFHHGRPGQARRGHPTTKDVREPATPARVQQHQGHQGDGEQDVDDDRNRSDYAHVQSVMVMWIPALGRDNHDTRCNPISPSRPAS